MASFCCANVLQIRDFKNPKPYQNIRGLQVVRPLLFYLEKISQIYSKFTPSDIWPVLSMLRFYLNMRRQQVVGTLLHYLEKFNQTDS